MGNARKLGTFIGTSVDQLQEYLNGEYSLEDYLRLPILDTGESELLELTDPVDKVITWMGSLSLRDLLRLISAGVRLAETTIGPNSEAAREKQNQLQQSETSSSVTASKSDFQMKDAELALKCWRDISQGRFPSNPELIKLAVALDVDTSWLKKTITKLSEIMANDTNN